MKYGVKQNDILALSPYLSQCECIHKKLKSSNLDKVNCTTVKSSEGMYAYAYMHACMYVCMYVCVYVCIYKYVPYSRLL